MEKSSQTHLYTYLLQYVIEITHKTYLAHFHESTGINERRVLVIGSREQVGREIFLEPIMLPKHTINVALF